MSRAPRHRQWLCPSRLRRFFNHSPRWGSVAAAPRPTPEIMASELIAGSHILHCHAPRRTRHRQSRPRYHASSAIIAGAVSSAIHAPRRSSLPGPRRPPSMPHVGAHRPGPRRPPSMPHIVEHSHWRNYRRQQRAGGDRDQCRTCVGRHYVVLPPTCRTHPHSLSVYPRRPSPTLLIVLLEQSMQQPAATTGVMHRQQLFHRSRATTTGGISSGAAHVAEKTWMKEMVPKEAIPSHTLGTVSVV